jgi:hypothetical protein
VDRRRAHSGACVARPGDFTRSAAFGDHSIGGRSLNVRKERKLSRRLRPRPSRPCRLSASRQGACNRLSIGMMNRQGPTLVGTRANREGRGVLPHTAAGGRPCRFRCPPDDWFRLCDFRGLAGSRHVVGVGNLRKGCATLLPCLRDLLLAPGFPVVGGSRQVRSAPRPEPVDQASHSPSQSTGSYLRRKSLTSTTALCEPPRPRVRS